MKWPTANPAGVAAVVSTLVTVVLVSLGVPPAAVEGCLAVVRPVLGLFGS